MTSYKNYLIKLESIQDIDDLVSFLKEASALVDVRVAYKNNHCSWSECGGEFPPENEIREIQFFKKRSDLDYYSFDDDDLIAVLNPDFPYYLYTREAYERYIKDNIAWENQKERILANYAERKSFDIISDYDRVEEREPDYYCFSYGKNDCTPINLESLILTLK